MTYLNWCVVTATNNKFVILGVTMVEDLVFRQVTANYINYQFLIS